MNKMKLTLPLTFFIVFSIISIFLTGIALYACGELFFYFYKGISINFSFVIILFLGKLSLYIGVFSGVMLWIANLLKK